MYIERWCVGSSLFLDRQWIFPLCVASLCWHDVMSLSKCIHQSLVAGNSRIEMEKKTWCECISKGVSCSLRLIYKDQLESPTHLKHWVLISETWQTLLACFICSATKRCPPRFYPWDNAVPPLWSPQWRQFLNQNWVFFYFYANYSHIYFPLQQCIEQWQHLFTFFFYKRGRQCRLCCLRCLNCAFLLDYSCCMMQNTWKNTSHASLVYGLPTLTSWGFQWKGQLSYVTLHIETRWTCPVSNVGPSASILHFSRP